MTETATTDPQQGILCMFSGGLDSLGTLYILLTDPQYAQYDIHAHHMVLRNLENRALAEQAACANIQAYFREKGYRDFKLTESTHEYHFLQNYYIWDVTLVGLLAGAIMRDDPSLTRLAGGRTKDDLEPDPGAYQRMNLGQRLFHTMLPLEIRYQRPYLHPVAHLTHEEIYRMLPADLRDLAWSCRTPRYTGTTIDECGECDACTRMKQIRLRA
jgi:hypothetical protein